MGIIILVIQETHKGLKRVTRVQCSRKFTLSYLETLVKDIRFQQNGCSVIMMRWY